MTTEPTLDADRLQELLAKATQAEKKYREMALRWPAEHRLWRPSAQTA